MSCDLCGKANSQLEPVNDIFRTEYVQVICPTCVSKANKQIGKIRGSTNSLFRNLVKEWMENMNKQWSGKK